MGCRVYAGRIAGGNRDHCVIDLHIAPGAKQGSGIGEPGEVRVEYPADHSGSDHPGGGAEEGARGLVPEYGWGE